MFKNLCSVGPNDLIWMNHDSHMHLFRVTENCIGSEEEHEWYAAHRDWYRKRDIGHFFLGEWIKEVRTSSVPGVVLNQMGYGTTFEEVKRAPELTYRVWNAWKGEDKGFTYETTDLSKHPEGIWDALTNRQVEGLVLSYLQETKGCSVLTETVKHTTKGYECVLVGKDGTRYYPQVKTGSTSKPAAVVNDLVKAMGEDEGDPAKKRAVVFFANQNYRGVPDGVETISKEEVIEFATQNGRLLKQGVRDFFAVFGLEVTG